MRKISLIVVHCSDSDIPDHDNIATIKRWHTRPLMPQEVADKIKNGKLPKSEAFKYGRGWSDVGYHYFIDKAGNVHSGRAESRIGAHVSGHNAGSIGICLSGRKLFTDAQFRSLEKLVKDLCKKYELEKKDILSHCDLEPKKTCPNFDLHKLVAGWGWQ